VLKLREQLTSQRDKRFSGYMSQDRSLSAYLNYHFPLHLPELFWIFEQNSKHLSKASFERVLDLGAGPGTASLSLLLWMKYQNSKEKKSKIPSDPKSLHLFDVSAKALVAAEQLIQVLSNCEIKKERGNLREDLSKLRNAYDLIILSHVLNEFGNGPRHRERKAQLIDRLAIDFLEPGSHMILIEPPLREPCLDLQWLRDLIANENLGGLEIVGPCPTKVELCPLSFESKGWCYAQPPRTEARALGLAPWDQRLEKMATVQLTHPGFSYLLLRKKSLNLSEKIETDHAIAISDNRTRPAWICSHGRNVKFNSKTNPHRGAYLRPEKVHASRKSANTETSKTQAPNKHFEKRRFVKNKKPSF